jgi:hypothetical protein
MMQGWISPSRDLQGTAQGRTLIGWAVVLGQHRVPRSVHGTTFCRCSSWKWRAKGYREKVHRGFLLWRLWGGGGRGSPGLLLEKEGVTLRRVWGRKERVVTRKERRALANDGCITSLGSRLAVARIPWDGAGFGLSGTFPVSGQPMERILASARCGCSLLPASQRPCATRK